MKQQLEAEVICKIKVENVEYSVECLARGSCYSEPAVLGGPPEDCRPEESECDLESVEVIRAHRLSDGVEITDPKLLTKLEKALDEDQLIGKLWEEYDVHMQTFDEE